MEQSGDKDQRKKKITEIKTFPVPFALEEIREAITISTNTLSKEQIIHQGNKLQLGGNIQEAAKLYQYFIDQGFKDHRVFFNYGLILNNLDKLQEAEIYTRKAIELNPEFAEAHCNLGNVLKDLGKLQEAEIYTRKAIELNPNFKEAHYNLGNVLKDLGKLQEAELSYRKAIELNPEFAEAHCNLGKVLKVLGKLQEAELSIRKAIELNPDDANAHLNLGNILKDLGKLQEAELSLRKAIELNPNCAIAYFILSLFIVPKVHDKILKFLFSEKILESKENISKSNQADIYFARGNILERKEDYKESYKMFRQANLITRKEFKSNFTAFSKALKIDNLSTIGIEEISKLESKDKDLPTPIFAVGLPRAGKSTIESILSNNNLLRKFGDRKGISEVIRDYKKVETSFQSIGIKINSTYKEIRTAYLRLSKQYHPDKGGDENLMAKIAEGYNFLRSEYEKKPEDYKRPNLYKFFLQKLDEDLASIDFTFHTSPNNILYTGVITTQIPKSKIIYCYRNPKDHIIELYKYNLKNYLPLKTSLIELAKIMVIINNQMEEYRNRFHSKIYFLNFDQLILEPKREIKSILNWLNWKYDDKYLIPKLRPKGSIESYNDFNSFNSSYFNKSKHYIEMLKPVEGILSKLIRNKND